MVSFREEQGLEEGETVTGVTEEQIKKRTVELWMDDVVKGKEKNNEPLVMLPDLEFLSLVIMYRSILNQHTKTLLFQNSSVCF